jgi:hypothetical protein
MAGPVGTTPPRLDGGEPGDHHQTVNLRSEGALTMGRAPGAEVIPLRGLSLWEHHLVWALLILKTLRKIKGVTPWKRGSSTSVLSRPVEQKTIRLTFALQHILHQQIPADKSGEDMVLRLLSSWSESLASVRIVALVH